MTSDKLIESIKRRASIPTNQITFTNDDFLAFADEEMSLGMVPAIQRMREDYLMRTDSVPLVANVLRYKIPYRATGNKLRELSYRDNNGNIFEMTRIMKEDLPYYNGPIVNTRIYAFYVENDEVVLVPDSLSIVSGDLQMTYYIRPNSLVLLEKVGVITGINTVTGDVTVSSIPEAFSVNSLYDFIQVKSPHTTMDFDVAPTAMNIVTNTITFDPGDLPTGLAVGDHLALATESAIPQVPSDLHAILAHRVATRCIEAMGDLENLQAANAKQAEFEQQLQTLIEDRVEGTPKKLVNRHALLRGGLYGRRYRFRG